MSLIDSYRTPQDCAMMAEYWCGRHYGGDTRPETLERIKADLNELNEIGLAYLYREVKEAGPIVTRLPDDFDPWAR